MGSCEVDLEWDLEAASLLGRGILGFVVLLLGVGCLRLALGCRHLGLWVSVSL